MKRKSILNSKLYIKFKILEDNTLSDLKIVKDPGYGLGNEVKKVFNGQELKIYCAMGSSGTPTILRATIEKLKSTPYRVVAATTSILDPEEFRPFSDRFYVTRYLPATPVNEMADLAVTHGGQGTIQNPYGRIFRGTTLKRNRKSCA